MPRSLAEWLDYQQRVHVRGIDLGLERVRRVAERMGVLRPAPVVITVAGTNGKGSTVAFLEAMLRASGRRVGSFTSPHLQRYNERIRIGGMDVADGALIDAFERIEAARAEITLTYFEFGTLAALDLFARAGLDVCVLEVGLGGRLDAVNIVDADAAIVTSIGLDHADYLGDDLDGIAREKAGVFRRGAIAVLAEAEPRAALHAAAAASGACCIVRGADFFIAADDNPADDLKAGGRWRWHNGQVSLDLPPPGLDAPCQAGNAAGAIAVLFALRDRLGWDPAAIAHGVAHVHIRGRLQRLAEAPLLIVDVAHNPQAAQVLAQWLGEHPAAGRTLAVFSALADKDIGAIGATLSAAVDHWFVAGLLEHGARGLAADAVLLALRAGVAALHATPCATVTDALVAAHAVARASDRIIAFGSFHVAADTLTFAHDNVLGARPAGAFGAA